MYRGRQPAVGVTINDHMQPGGVKKSTVFTHFLTHKSTLLSTELITNQFQFPQFWDRPSATPVPFRHSNSLEQRKRSAGSEKGAYSRASSLPPIGLAYSAHLSDEMEAKKVGPPARRPPLRLRSLLTSLLAAAAAIERRREIERKKWRYVAWREIRTYRHAGSCHSTWRTRLTSEFYQVGLLVFQQLVLKYLWYILGTLTCCTCREISPSS